jgi:serine/threonine protein kinase
MMHRDLKSPNVLLSEEGVAKIADVGMVRSQVKDLVTAQPVMTPLWAAPEVVRHERASIKAVSWHAVQDAGPAWRARAALPGRADRRLISTPTQ